MAIELKDYENTIRTLVWKFRNLGFADAMYAPVIDTGTEAIAENKMANVEEGSEEKKSFRYTVKNFEDLISEGYLIFTELKNQFESMGIYCDTCGSKCDFYFQMQDVCFEQALITKLQSHFTNMYTGLMCQKRSASFTSLETVDGDTLINLPDNFIDRLQFAYDNDNIPDHLVELAKAILDGTIDVGIREGITKRSISTYLAKLGWKRKDIRHLLYENLV